MAIIQFGAWRPDQPRLGNTCVTANNVYPTENGYKPFPGPSASGDALAAAAVGAISFKRVDGTLETFVGTSTKLYQRNGTSWTDVSKAAGTYTSSTFWRFALYGSRLIATNGVDNPQAFDLGTDSEFADLPNAPIHNFPIVIRDTVVALDCASGSEIQWSANNDSETWSAACGGGSQPVVDGGPVIGGTGGEFGVVLQEFGLTRMNFVGGDLRFTFDRIEGSIGAIAPDSIVQYKGHTFYLSDEGFQDFDGASSKNISDEAVTQTFFDALTYASKSSVRGALDPRNSSVIWTYPTSGTTKLIGYNYKLGRWFESDSAVTVLHTGFTSSGNVLSAFDGDNKLTLFNGTDLAADIGTGDIQLASGRSAFVRSVRGLVDSAHDIDVIKKTDLADSGTTDTGSSNTNGKVSVRSHGRYHSFLLEPTATFTEATGIDIEASVGGTKV